MKRFLKALSLSLALLMLLTAMAACTPEDDVEGSESQSKSETTEAETQDNTVKDEKVEYTISVKTIGGLPVSRLTFHIYKGDDLTAYGQTDENGIGKISLAPSNDYTVELSASSLEGYAVEARYPFSGRNADIVLTSSVILDSDLTGVTYELGDIIRDFTVTTTEGTTFTLSDALKTKKGVLINFWYSTCSPCINEFPFMQSAYEKFSEDIEVIALNNYAGDNEVSVKDFKANMGLTFPMAKDYSQLYKAFTPLIQSLYNGQTGYPTSIFIDRYGAICLVELGGLTSEKPFIAAFEHFTSDNYTQQLIESLDKLTPIEKPDVEMPSSEEIGAAINGEGFTATYYPETEASDAEYSWPFIIGELNGESCVYPSNSYKDASFATLNADVVMNAGDALAVEWYASSEKGVDILYILVDGKDIYQLSGDSTAEGWKTCYPYVAKENGTYKITFIYLKDDSEDFGEDRIYLKNLHTISEDKVDVATYIPRQAATKPNANGLGFQSYVTPVYNEKDGYYHVGTADGPILLVNLMDKTQLSSTSLNDHGYNGDLIYNGTDLYVRLVDYCNYSINGTLYGYCPVTEELKGILEKAAAIIGFEQNNPDQWLQACSYYDAYGTDNQLDDPVKGIAFFAAYETFLSTENETVYNTVTYDGRVIMPRGLKFKFVPEVSGVYFIKSQSSEHVDGWIFDENYECIHTASVVDRPWGNNALDTINVSMIDYFEAGKTYYIDIAYYDVYAEGTFTFTVNYIGATFNHFHLASPGYFTFVESTGGQMNETIAGGIDVALGDDGYYHELRADGTLGSIVYADFSLSTGIFSHSIDKMIEMGGFNFSLSETDQMVIAKLNELGGDVDACRSYYKELWAEAYEEWDATYKLEEVLAGTYHGTGEDLTESIKEYAAKKLGASENSPELEGCVPVDEALAEILQQIMDKYSFKNVNHSWTKLCYYYKLLG